MGVGIGILLIAVGLILSLAVKGTLQGVDLELVGWILTGVGALSIVVSLLMVSLSRRRTEIIDVRANDQVSDQRFRPPY